MGGYRRRAYRVRVGFLLLMEKVVDGVVGVMFSLGDFFNFFWNKRIELLFFYLRFLSLFKVEFFDSEFRVGKESCSGFFILICSRFFKIDEIE